ncbi:unnamed protein product [Cyprideis torosa]|uniref:Uncharacterized protein n=1 Tax=Cyprideis torosa TaxID=163714 RepID=A0A7R8W2L5_9CRUS|nr:unnamed protein product [Cyprideis torosa]CAG0882072.1 unnamed protein product [Cyprideis torosa]
MKCRRSDLCNLWYEANINCPSSAYRCVWASFEHIGGLRLVRERTKGFTESARVSFLLFGGVMKCRRSDLCNLWYEANINCPSSAYRDNLLGTENYVSTPCGHVFHTICIENWLINSPSCPTCRLPVGRNNLTRLFFDVLPDALGHEEQPSQEQLVQLEQEVAELQNSIRVQSARVTELEDSIRLVRANVTEVQHSLRLERAKVTELQCSLRLERETLTELQHSLHLERAKVTELQGSLRLEREKVTELQDSLRLKRAKVTELQGFLRLAQDDRTEMTELKHSLRLERSRIRVESSRMRDVERAALQRQQQNQLQLKKMEEKVVLFFVCVLFFYLYQHEIAARKIKELETVEKLVSDNEEEAQKCLAGFKTVTEPALALASSVAALRQDLKSFRRKNEELKRLAARMRVRSASEKAELIRTKSLPHKSIGRTAVWLCEMATMSGGPRQNPQTWWSPAGKGTVYKAGTIGRASQVLENVQTSSHHPKLFLLSRFELKMAYKLFALLVLIGCVSGDGGHGHHGHGHHGHGSHGHGSHGHGHDHSSVHSSLTHGHQSSIHGEDARRDYQFGFHVQDDYTGILYKQNEQRLGLSTSGSYSVLLPDNRLQIVTYNADADKGFTADVQYNSPGHGDVSSSYEPPAPKYGPGPAYDPPKYDAPASSYGQPAYEEPSYEEPRYQQPSYYEPKPSYQEPKPTYIQPSYESKPTYGAPSYKAEPTYGAPSYKSEPTYNAPSYQPKLSYKPYEPKIEYQPEPTYKSEPTYGAPSYKSEPTYGAPSYKSEPTYGAPSYKSEPTYGAPSYESEPTYGAPSYKSEPTYGAPKISYGGFKPIHSSSYGK